MQTGAPHLRLDVWDGQRWAFADAATSLMQGPPRAGCCPAAAAVLDPVPLEIYKITPLLLTCEIALLHTCTLLYLWNPIEKP